jgi:hypothetical protein
VISDAVTISIPHTGTYFTIKLFTDAGYQDRGMCDRRLSSIPLIYHGHVDREEQVERALELARTLPLVIPFRHPYRVEHSWDKSRWSLDALLQCYRTFVEKFLPLKPHLMPVDSPRRAELLAQISASLGVELKTDGSVINSLHKTHGMQMSEFSPSKRVIELAKSLEPIMAEL